MPTPPKLTPAEWQKVRSAWEVDERAGYTWIVESMRLPLSANAVRKRAVAEGWTKVRGEELSAPLVAARDCAHSGVAPRTIREPSQGGANYPQTIDEQTAEELRPFKTRETPTLDELDRSEPRQAIFVREYVKDLNATQSAIRAGYSTERPDVQGARLLADGRVQACVRELRDELLRGIEIEAKDVLKTLVLQLNADINEISQYRRVCCRSCWGQDHQRQCTPMEYQDAKLKHDEKRTRLLTRTEDVVDIGEFPSYEFDWYDKRREPNPECPECFGEGLGEVFFGDTRKLSKAAKALYGGVKVGKEGIEIVVANREKVIDQLARTLGMFKDNINVNVAPMNIERLQADFERMMKQADERQRRVLEERGIPLDGEFKREA